MRGAGSARLGATQPARGSGGRPAARSIDDADYVTRREFETRLKMMDDKLQLLAVALRQREAQHEDLELQVRELASRLPMPGANFGGAPGRASPAAGPGACGSHTADRRTRRDGGLGARESAGTPTAAAPPALCRRPRRTDPSALPAQHRGQHTRTRARRTPLAARHDQGRRHV